ncbi:hypothetical protein FRC06_011131 [Ceratobasidium sp. 370]|nr:hypothetical protein FRC06_011131 [Ceratobasidium sp. 370]
MSQIPDKSYQVSHLSLVMPHGASEAALETKLKPRFVEFACSHHEVLRYVKTIVDEVIPHAFWGSVTNRRVIDSHIEKVITQRRFETLTLHTLMQRLRVADCEWLGETKDRRVCQSDALKRAELLREFVYWFFDSFLMPLIRTSFYVTETSALQHQLLYFRHDDWQTLCAPLLDKLSGETFERIDPSETIAERDGSPTDCKSGSQGESQASKAFKSSLLRPDGSMPKLYFVKLDVRACFDTIEQGKLLSILKQSLTQDGYMIRKFSQLQFSTGQTRRTFHKKAVPDLEHTHFMTYAARLAACLRHVVFADQVVYGFDYQEETLQLLEEHITDNIVRIGSDLYRQVVGIPQGSILSTLLCAIFYGNLEETELQFTQDPGNVLLRFVDDYLFITADVKVARKFLKIMHKGHPEYGCEVAEEKTLTNFADAEVQTLVLAPENEYFPWCGRIIHMKELSVQWDYSRYRGKHVAHGLTVDQGRQPGAKFRTRILQMARQHCHAMYFDSALTSLRKLYVNVAQNFFWVAMKMYNYVREWGIRVNQHIGFIANIVTQVVHYAFTSMRSRMSGSLAKELGATFKFDCHSF